MFSAVTALEGLHVIGKYKDQSMQHTCSRHAAWGPHSRPLLDYTRPGSRGGRISQSLLLSSRQRYLAPNITPTSLGPPKDPRHTQAYGRVLGGCLFL